MKLLAYIISILIIVQSIISVQIARDIVTLSEIKKIDYIPKHKVLGIQIANAIKKVESEGNYYAKGKSGEYGAYQMMPTTFKSLSKDCLGEIVLPTPENQDKIAHCTFEKLVKSGKKPKEIIQWWNSGSFTRCPKGINNKGVPYDCPAYVQKVLSHVK